MRSTHIRILLAALATGPILQAQPDRPSSGHGYAFVAPGRGAPGGPAVLHSGVGGEGFLWKGLAGGAEVGYLHATSSGGLGIGIFSANAAYHFGRTAPEKRFSPFVTGGYSLAFRSGSLSLLNLGVGAHYWFRPRLGLRVEFRDHWRPSRSTDFHIWEVRFGVAFR